MNRLMIINGYMHQYPSHLHVNGYSSKSSIGIYFKHRFHEFEPIRFYIPGSKMVYLVWIDYILIVE